MSFQRPDSVRIVDALGDISQLPKDMQMAVSNRLDESFQPVPVPRDGDWLKQHQERGQTMKSFETKASKAVPHGTYKTIFIQPIGSFDHPRAAKLNVILEFARVFFAGCEVELLPGVDFSPSMKSRDNGGVLQYLTGNIHTYIAQTRHLRDTKRELLCVAVTMADIYPDESWNFVYGQARSSEGVGVYSFARLDPLFYHSTPKEILQTPLTEEHRIIMLRRCIKILLHEVGHLFGLNHCIYYICLMNGANNEREMDRQPLLLCPVCLHKLYSSLRFDVRQLTVATSVAATNESGEATPNTSGSFEVTVDGKLVHSKKKGDGFPDTQEKMNKIVKAVDGNETETEVGDKAKTEAASGDKSDSD
ncbi:unnamed protein product [Adineta ricciae]|uniref:Archaemetzincin-2 n=1 Tax=Adineta ricciae TaxID=249248 RepID=A0A814MC25_ADIRI|nr:unnamed protein product [Adineta ricciae]